MDYIAIDINKFKTTSTNTIVTRVQDTDQLIDENNIDYIKNINSVLTSLDGTYTEVSTEEAEKVNDSLQYWGSIHMFGTETIPMTTKDYRIEQENKKISQAATYLKNLQRGGAEITDEEIDLVYPEIKDLLNSLTDQGEDV